MSTSSSSCISAHRAIVIVSGAIPAIARHCSISLVTTIVLIAATAIFIISHVVLPLLIVPRAAITHAVAIAAGNPSRLQGFLIIWVIPNDSACILVALGAAALIITASPFLDAVAHAIGCLLVTIVTRHSIVVAILWPFIVVIAAIIVMMVAVAAIHHVMAVVIVGRGRGASIIIVATCITWRRNTLVRISDSGRLRLGLIIGVLLLLPV